MTDHSSDQITGSLGGKAAGMGDMSSSVESPKLAPDQELSAPPPDAIKPETPKAEAPKVEVKAEAPDADAPRETGKVMIMAPSRDRSWDNATIEHGPAAADAAQASGGWGKRASAIAAIAVLAAIAGAIGGSFATSSAGHGVASEQSSAATNRTQAMEATIKRLESEVAALKTGADRAAKGDAGQFAKVNDRMDKMEKAHADSAAKLAKLNDSAEKQHVAAAPASPAQAKEVTGSIPATTAAPVPLPSPKPEFARLPKVDGWVLRDVANGGALIEGRTGIYEVYAGDPVPGLGRVDAIRKQDGRWVVVTSRGLVVAR
ncbi:MAG: hypothetical protein ACTHN2_07880 [Nitrobacter sp.]